MKFHPGEDQLYLSNIAPTEEEDTATYANRLDQTLTEWGVPHDAEDIALVIALAKKSIHLYPGLAALPVAMAASSSSVDVVSSSSSSGGKKTKLTKKEQMLKEREEEKEARNSARIYYSAKFEEHIFKGEPDGKAHKGLHSLCLVKALDKSKQPAIDMIDVDGTFNTFAASAAFPGQGAKSSSFFPTEWPKAKVLAVIDEAVRWGWNNPVQSRNEAAEFGLKWVGYALVDGGLLMVGGIGGGDGSAPGKAIETAFPAVNNKFTDFRD